MTRSLLACIFAAVLLPACTDLGETVDDGLGVSWSWEWQLREVCADDSRAVVDTGSTCTDNHDAWRRAYLDAMDPTDPGACGSPGVRWEMAMEPDGPC